MKLEPPTTKERAVWPKTVIVEPTERFADDRGEILALVDLPMNSCVLISSKAGTVRANHYHETDWHYCYVVSGSIEYYHRPVGATEPPESVLVQQGQTFFTPPQVEHAMVFPEDTTFLTLGRNSRRQEVYEADVRRVDLVSPDRHGE